MQKWGRLKIDPLRRPRKMYRKTKQSSERLHATATRVLIGTQKEQTKFFLQ
jgi:hypothetical protein